MGEQLFRVDPKDANPARATILIVPPLFEEANRTRRTLVLAMHALAAQGFAAVLPDLPGQNESLVPLESVDLDQWRTALADCAAALPTPVLVASVRGGCLIDDWVNATAFWRLVPVSGASLLRTLLRARVTSDRESGMESSIDSLKKSAIDAPLLLAGNPLSPAMVTQLGEADAAAVAPLRSVSLNSGKDHISGTPLWLRAEPGEDQAMADAIAADIIEWSQSCGAI